MMTELKAQQSLRRHRCPVTSLLAAGLTVITLFMLAAPCTQAASPTAPGRAGNQATTRYASVQRTLASGWNTWNTRSVLSHVLLPEGFAVNLGIKEDAHKGSNLKEAQIGRMGKEDEIIRPGLHAVDGRYTELELEWMGLTIRVQTAVQQGDLLVLVTPSAWPAIPPRLIVEPGFLWNRPGWIRKEGRAIVGHAGARAIPVYATGASVDDPHVVALSSYFAIPLDAPVGLSTGRRRSLAEITAAVTATRAMYAARFATADGSGELRQIMETVLAWDTIYDPLGHRVITPVSRIWNVGGESVSITYPVQYQGHVLYEWDTCLAAFMFGVLGHSHLAYANLAEVLSGRTEDGFVPCFYRSMAQGIKSRDRSQPPLASWVTRELFRRYHDVWFLEKVFDDLLAWNRWWIRARVNQGLLAWGSNPYQPRIGYYGESDGVGALFGAALESGLDNSPMYDDVPFNQQTHTMELQDVGLNAMYVLDCDALSDIAGVLGRTGEQTELKERAAHYRGALGQLWSEEHGIFLNRRVDTGTFSTRLSPTLFYPLLARAATPAQAARMVHDHLQNPAEFAGEWILPSIARNDPAFKDNDYWRGRVWAPMNFLVYLGLREYDLPEARGELVTKSRALLLGEWRGKGHVHENYNSVTGEGCDVVDSDRFYHWGALLGVISLMEDAK
jgi:putative isomerase